MFVGSTSLGRPPGFKAIVVAISGEMQRTGERTELPLVGLSSWDRLSLAVRRRPGAEVSTGDISPDRTPAKNKNQTL